MKHASASELKKEEVKAYGSKDTTIQWWTRPETSKYFMLRRFEIGSGGEIGVHGHPEEHQIYILKGPIILIDKDGKEISVQSDEFVYVDPHELHGYKNPNNYAVSFICGIPKLT
jgi:quercetin dioxygenase-like cupin family protein